MTQKIKQYVKKYNVYRQIIVPHHKLYDMLESLFWSSAFMKIVFIDFITDLPSFK